MSDEFDIREAMRKPDVTTPDGGTDLRGLRVGDKVIVNGATMYVSEISEPRTFDDVETLRFEVSIMPPHGSCPGFWVSTGDEGAKQ